jgi:hypothetical protein
MDWELQPGFQQSGVGPRPVHPKMLIIIDHYQYLALFFAALISPDVLRQALCRRCVGKREFVPQKYLGMVPGNHGSFGTGALNFFRKI